MEGLKKHLICEKLLSIIVPVYNVKQYLKRCIISLLDQDIEKTDYEIIIINDGSTDGSYEIAKEFALKYDNIILITQENKGLSGARNTGLEKAVGKYVLFVDSDDMLLSNVIARILQTAVKNNLDVCAYRIIRYDEAGKEHLCSIQPFAPDFVYNGRYAITHGADIGAVWLNLYSRTMIEKYHLRFLDKIYHEDVDFNLRMYAYANRIMFLDHVAYCYYYNDSAISRITSKDKAVKHILDNFLIVRHIRDFSNSDERGKVLRDFYTKHGNSLLISCLFDIYKSKKMKYCDKLCLFEKAKALKLYPIKGCTLSWKTTAILPFLNREWLYKKLLKLSSLHNK